MRKKLTALFLAVIMTMSLMACGSGSSNGGETQAKADTASSQKQTVDNTPVSEDANSTDAEAPENEEKAGGSYEWELIYDVKPDANRKSTAGSEEMYDSIVVSVANVPADLSPFTMSNAITNMEIFDTLLDQTGPDEFIGRMAKEWNEVDDTHFVVEIYDNVYDSDGNNITASDVVFSFDTFNNSGFARDFNYYDSAKALDTYTVEFTWKEPIEGLTNFASMMTKTYIVSEKAYNEHDFITDPVGSGPYILKEYVTASYAVIEAKEDYWQSDEALVSPNTARNVKTIRYDFITDASMSAVAFEDGSTINVSLNADNISMFEEGGEYADLGRLYCYPDTVSISIVPNMSGDSVVSDINLRMAMFYAFDTEGFAASLGERLYSPVTTDASPAISDYSEDWSGWDTYQNTYDPELAAEYLEKSDYNGEKLVILVEGNAQKENVATVIQAYLESIGIKSEIKIYDHALISNYASRSDEWDLFLASSGDSDYTANRLRKVYGQNAGYAKGLNISLYDNQEFQDMIDNANTVSGYSVDATTELLKYIYDNALGYGTAYVVNVVCYSDCVAQFQIKYGSSEVLYGACEYYLD